MKPKPGMPRVWACAMATLASLAGGARASDLKGTVKGVDVANGSVVIQHVQHEETTVRVLGDATLGGKTGAPALAALRPGDRVTVRLAGLAADVSIDPEPPHRSIIEEFWYNFRHNLFKPLLLFFYMGFLVPILRVKFEFPYVIYQSLTVYLLIAIGWKGGEELSALKLAEFGPVCGLMVVGFVTNGAIGILAYVLLSMMTRLRRVDRATVAGYYGSDSAGTFVTCLGVLAAAHIAYGAYMPVMLAVMEVPGCLVALYLVSRLRHQGMDPAGYMPDEPGYDPRAPAIPALSHGGAEAEAAMALEKTEHDLNGETAAKPSGFVSPQLLHEVFLNPGLFLLFGGILIGFLSGLQGHEVTKDDDSLFITLFQGVLCLFLLEMGMTASRRLRDLRTAGAGYIAFGLIAPNLFAALGLVVARAYSLATGTHLEIGTYVLFSVLCAAASYIAVPAVQRMAIPEASPTLPLAASLGLTFSYNVTIGIPIYIEVARALVKYWH
jgi:hypothetical protein